MVHTSNKPKSLMSKYAHLMKDTKSSAIRTNHMKVDKYVMNNLTNKTNQSNNARSISPINR